MPMLWRVARRAFFPPFLLSFLLIIVLLLLFKWNDLFAFFSLRLGLSPSLTFVAALLIYLTPQALPLAACIGGYVSAYRMNLSSEWIAARTLGYRKGCLLLPFSTIGILLSSLSLLFLGELSPLARLQSKKTLHEALYRDPLLFAKKKDSLLEYIQHAPILNTGTSQQLQNLFMVRKKSKDSPDLDLIFLEKMKIDAKLQLEGENFFFFSSTKEGFFLEQADRIFSSLEFLFPPFLNNEGSQENLPFAQVQSVEEKWRRILFSLYPFLLLQSSFAYGLSGVGKRNSKSGILPLLAITVFAFFLYMVGRSLTYPSLYVVAILLILFFGLRQWSKCP